MFADRKYERRAAIACFLLLPLMALLAAVAPFKADASSGGPPSTSPAASYGAVTLAATTATKIPAKGLFDRNGIQVTNLDPVRIWCGWDASVTDATGTPVEPGGGKQAFEISYTSQGIVNLWCYSVAGQTAPLNTRYTEVR